jgi:hypothetical protein
MGETALDQETFDDYLSDIREHYTADKVEPSFSLCGRITDTMTVSSARYDLHVIESGSWHVQVDITRL